MQEKAKDLCRIIIAGDICINELSLDLFRRGDVYRLFGDLLPVFSSAEFFLANLECPLIEAPSPSPKIGPAFGAPTDAIHGLQRARVHAVNLANNHIMDHGPAGLSSTLRVCEGAGICSFGAGGDLMAAGQLLIREIGGLRIAFLGMAEKEFGMAAQNCGGANPLDLVNFVRLVRCSRAQYDHLVILLHAGVEHYPLPTPNLQRTCRFLVEEGAAAVICQHSHCPGAYEIYRGAPIVYGQGNFIADSPCNHTLPWYQGYLVRLTWSDARVLPAMESIPYVQSYHAPGARRMTEEEEKTFRQDLAGFSQLLRDERTLRTKWLNYCLQEKSSYLSGLRGHGRFLRRVNGRTDFVERCLTPQAILTMLNMVRCESHHEALLTILQALHQQQEQEREQEHGF